METKNQSPLSDLSPSDLLYHTLEGTPGPPNLDLYQCPLILHNQIFHHSRQGLRYHIFPANRKNSLIQYPTITRNRELSRLTDTSTVFKFEFTVKFIGLNLDPNPTSTQISYRTFPSAFVVTSSHFTSTDETPFDHQWKR